MKRIYLDFAGATPVDPRVVKEVSQLLERVYGNALAPYEEGLRAKEVCEGARQRIARSFGVRTEEIVFTSGGTESNNLAILGAVRARQESGVALNDMHIITSAIEHASVREPIRMLKARGVEVSEVSVRSDGRVDPKEVVRHLTDKTVLVSIMYANNEIGVIEPIREIAHQVKTHGPKHLLVHTDLGQAPFFEKLSPHALGVDLMTVDAQKLSGPKGIGALYVKHGVLLAPLFYGGGQERGLRPGTHNPPLIAGFAKALELLDMEREDHRNKLKKLQTYLFRRIVDDVPGALINGSQEYRLPNNVHISLPGIDTEFLAVKLDQRGIACATKSNCLDGEVASYVVQALGGAPGESESTLRITFGPDFSQDMIETFLSTLVALMKE